MPAADTEVDRLRKRLDAADQAALENAKTKTQTEGAAPAPTPRRVLTPKQWHRLQSCRRRWQKHRLKSVPLSWEQSLNAIFIELISDVSARGERVVVATVADTRGSTPQRRGAKMLFFENGETAGTVGGGCVEAEVWAEAREAMRSGESKLHHFTLTADEASEEGMVCGGTMDIFIEVWKQVNRES